MKTEASRFDTTLKRSGLALAIGLCVLSSQVFAQSATGSIFGKADADATVTIENLDTGTRRSVTAGDDGRFSATQLPTGRYRVTSGALRRDINVAVGTGTAVNFASGAEGNGDLDTIRVVGNNVNPIDVSSVESTTVFSQAQIQALPVARDITNVALLAPGTVQGDGGFGNLASFGGSSVAENGYYINGFDVTNLRKLLSYAAIPFDAVGEQQVKTGGYGAEFGRSLGGVINLVTKRGGNEWKGGASLYWEPSGLAERGRDVRSRNPEDIASGRIYSRFVSADTSTGLNFNAYASGPIVKDKLFVFALLEGRRDSSDAYGYSSSLSTSDRSPQGLLKLDWNITDNHLLELTAIGNHARTDYRHYQNSTDYATSHDVQDDKYTVENGGDIYIGRYTGYFGDDFNLSLMAGQLRNVDNWRTRAPLGSTCPAAYDSRSGGLDYIGCWNESAFTIGDRDFGKDRDRRTAYRVDAEWQLGDHQLRFGYDQETFLSRHAGSTYSGGIYYRYFSNTSVRVRHFQSTSGSYRVQNAAGYVEDSWRINDRWLAYLGLRSESFNNRNGDGQSFVKADNMLAPRLGFAWDVRGDSSFKLYGNLGRYFIPVASNTNIRASGAEQTTTEFYSYTGIDPVTGAPVTLGPRTSGPFVSGSLTPPDPRTVAVTDLKPMYQDEFILGGQWTLQDWVFGAKGVYRQVRNGMDDYCSHAAFEDWAADNGHANFDSSLMAPCFIMNPGRDVKLAIDLDGSGQLTEVTVPKRYFGLPSYQRRYAAVELNIERPKKDGWFLQGSYTYAKSTGNVEGYVNSSLEQVDAGLTQDFDNRLFEDGAYGPLPNDRRHTLKLFGTYDFSKEWTGSANVLVQSGRPVNCQGYVPIEQLGATDTNDLESYSASSFYCLRADGVGADATRELLHRGSQGRTPWTNRLDIGLTYRPEWADGHMQFGLDVFNVFNSQIVTERDEAGELVRTTDDNDLDNDGNTDEFVYRRNPNFLNATNFQSPRSFRFTVRYTW